MFLLGLCIEKRSTRDFHDDEKESERARERKRTFSLLLHRVQRRLLCFQLRDLSPDWRYIAFSSFVSSGGARIAGWCGMGSSSYEEGSSPGQMRSGRARDKVHTRTLDQLRVVKAGESCQHASARLRAPSSSAALEALANEGAKIG